MNENFKKGLEYVYVNEGFRSDDKFDAGGSTYRGVSVLFLRAEGIDVNRDGRINSKDIDYLQKNPELIEKIYFDHFYKKCKADRISHYGVATALFDSSVLFGTGRGQRMLQKAINEQLEDKISEDGVIGSITLSKLELCDPNKIIESICWQRVFKHVARVDKKKSQTKFLLGWTRRAKRLLELCD